MVEALVDRALAGDMAAIAKVVKMMREMDTLPEPRTLLAEETPRVPIGVAFQMLREARGEELNA